MRKRLEKKLRKQGRLREIGPNRKKMEQIRRDEENFKQLVNRLSRNMGVD